MTYKLYKTLDGKDAAMSVGVDPQVSFIFDEQNTDYQAFLKYQAEGGKVYGADEEIPVINTPIPADE
jgi:hypothetical protein